MAERNRRRGARRSGSGRDDFEDRDLLVGRQEGAADSGAPDPSQRGQSSGVGSDATATAGESLAHILATLRLMKARLDVLETLPEASEEATLALERAKVQLNKAVQDARGALAVAAVPDAKRKQEAANSAALLTDGAQALKDQAGEIEKRLEQSRKRETAVDGAVARLEEAAADLRESLGSLQSELDRRTAERRRRRWLAGAVLAGAVAVSLVIGAVVERETGIAALGDPRHLWVAYVARHYAPRLAECAARARVDGQGVVCRVAIRPPLAVTFPLHPGGPVTIAPPDG